MTALELFGLSVAVMLPWLTGSAWVRAVLAGRPASNIPLIVGYGFPLGVLFVMAIMLVWQAMGLDQSFPRTCSVLVILAAIPPLLLRSRFLSYSEGDRFPPSSEPVRRRRTSPLLPLRERKGGWLLRITCLALLALILFRFGGFFLEIIWRPVFPWDAWFYYAPRVKVWFEYGSLVDFVPPREWWTAVEPAFTAGSGRHPDGIPLIQYWTLQGLGRYDDALMNLPWFFAGASACIALYGLARAAGAGALVSLAAVYVLASLPMFGSHVALAGYGDLWVGVYLMLAAGAVYLGVRDRDWRALTLALAAVAGMLMIKESGPLWILPLMAGLLFGWLRLRWAALIAAASAALLVGAGYLAGLEFELARLGRFAIGPDGIELPGYTPIWGDLATHLFVMASWHLLWFVTPFVLVAAAVLSRRDRAVRALSVTVVAGLALLLFAFKFTHASQWVIDGTSVNRILLHLVPALVLLGAVVCSRLRAETLASPFFPVFAIPVLAALLLWSGFTLWVLYMQPEAFSFSQLQVRLFGDWLDFRLWNTPSINRVQVAGGEALVSPVLAVAGWVALCAALLLLLPRVWKPASGTRGFLPIAVLILASGWLLLDMRWQGDLLNRLNDTRIQFAGKDAHERRAADFDGPLFEFMQSMKEEIGDPSARMWIFSELPLLHFRARYHALPQPAQSTVRPLTVGMARRFRTGDFIVLLDDKVVRPGNVRRVISPPVHELIRKFESEVSRDGRTYRVPPREESTPGFYHLRARVRGEGEFRLQVRMARLGGESNVIAERWFNGDSGDDYSLPFLLPMPGKVEYRVLVPPDTELNVEEISVEWLQGHEHLAFLAAARDGPFVVVRPFLQSDVAMAFEVL